MNSLFERWSGEELWVVQGKEQKGAIMSLLLLWTIKTQVFKDPLKDWSTPQSCTRRSGDGQTSACLHPPLLSEGAPCISSLPGEKERPKNSFSNAGRWVCEMCIGNIWGRPRNYKEIQGNWASLVVQSVKNLPAMQETGVQFLGWKDPLEKEMATHSSMLVWRIPWTEEPGRLQSIGS